MKYFVRICCLSLCLFSFGAWSADPPSHFPPRFTPEQFASWYAASFEDRLIIPSEIENRAKNHHYIFVTGREGEQHASPHYFADQVHWLQSRHDIPEQQITVVRTKTRKTFDENVGELRETLANSYRSVGLPQIVVAHSRGAALLVAYALRHPDEFDAHIKQAWLVQAAFETPLAELVLNVSGARKPGPKMGIKSCLEAYYMKAVYNKKSQRVRQRNQPDTLEELSPDVARAFWEQEKKGREEAMTQLYRRTAILRTWVEPRTQESVKRIAGQYMQTYFGKNDGMVLYERQTMAGIGRNWFSIYGVGHAGLTNSAKATEGVEFRHALAGALFMMAGQENVTLDEFANPPPHDEVTLQASRPTAGRRAKNGACPVLAQLGPHLSAPPDRLTDRPWLRRAMHTISQ